MTPKGGRARARLLACAAEELAGRGGDLELRDVTRRAQVSAGLPYRYFGSRAGLLEAVVDDFFDGLDAVALAEPPDDSWADRERARIEAWVAHLYAHPLAPMMVGSSGADTVVTNRSQARLDRYIDLGTRNIARAQRDGEIPGDVDPELLVAALLGGICTATARALTRTPRPSRRALSEQLWEFTVAAARWSRDDATRSAV